MGSKTLFMVLSLLFAIVLLISSSDVVARNFVEEKRVDATYHGGYGGGYGGGLGSQKAGCPRSFCCRWSRDGSLCVRCCL